MKYILAALTAPEDERDALARLLADLQGLIWDAQSAADQDDLLDDASMIIAAGYTRGASAAMREALIDARDALERLASPLAFDTPRMASAEETARMFYAEEAQERAEAALAAINPDTGDAE